MRIVFSARPEPRAGSSAKRVRKASFLAALALLPLLAQDALAQAAGCTTAGLPQAQIKLVGGKFVFVRPLVTVLDSAVDDFGKNAGGDGLDVYCVTKVANAPRGSLAMCLTGETCPWR